MFDKRKRTMLKLFLSSSGWKRAQILKKSKTFHKMGINCYYHPVKIPAEPWLVEMGDNVFVSTDVLLVTHNMANCVFNNESGTQYKPQTGTIKINNNVFIGARAIILNNVEIGNNVIIAAGSVVTKDIPDNSVVAGVPAKVIGNYNDQKRKCQEYNNAIDIKTKGKNYTSNKEKELFYYYNE